jgi:NAD(P) transhydrogenase
MSDSYDYDLVCIGSGPAGQRAAVQAAKLGHRAAVVEKRRAVGGVSIDTGTIPSKTLREAVVTFSGLAGKGDRLPWAKLDARPTCQQLFSGIDIVIAREIEVVENQLRRNDVTLLTGEASFVDPHTLMIRADRGWRQISGDQILIAVGTHPAHPPGIRADGEVILNTDDVVKLKQLPRTLAVVGAGVIGIEYTSIFAALGVAVTLVERRERPLEFLDREIVDELFHQMRARNVTFRFGEAVESIEVADGPPRKAVLHLESGKRIVTDMVLYSAGRIAATDALNLLNAGIAADERGRVTVDDCFRTPVPNISVFNYPTLAECYKVAALDASNKLRY